MAALHGHGSDVTVVAFSPDGTRLASGSGDFTVRLWDTVPLAVRLRERQAVLTNYADAESLVDRLWAELIQPSAVAAALRSDPQLDNWLRHAALNLVLRRAAPGRE